MPLENFFSKLSGKKQCFAVFLIALFISAVIFIPFIIADSGYFFFYGDFNVQQIPFYMHAHDLVRSGNIGWDWGTDLGASFVGSYSFYLLFSPFFWLTLLFPTYWLPQLMAPLLMLKGAFAALTAFLYIRRFTRTPVYALVGSLMYAFSGFAMHNVFFNHFYEPIVFFPLLLLGMEKSWRDGKFGYFAAAIAVNVVVNYWFFIGEVIFCIIYFFVREYYSKRKFNIGRFALLFVEAVLGLGLAMVVFLPSVLAIMGNTRVGTNSVILGADLWYYSNPQRYLGILHSIFMMPDLPSINNFFPDHGAVWSSLAAYIPVFGAVGVVSYCVYRKSSWLRTMLLISFTMAMVPVLNHLFVLMNNSYYTRWFYMPVLLMSLATAVALQDSEKSPLRYGSSNTISLNAGFKLCAVVIVLLILISGATPIRSDGGIKFGMYSIALMFVATSAITVLGYLVALVWYKTADITNYNFRLVLLTFVGCIVLGFSTVLIGKLRFGSSDWIKDEALPARDDMRIDELGEFYRIDAAEAETNMPIFWNMPSIQAFHSIVPVSIMKFYPEIGEKRDVSSKPSFSNKSLKSLLSVKYIYRHTNKEKLKNNSYKYLETRHSHDIYEFEDYIPMGFAYSNYIDQKKWDSIPKSLRTDYMLYAVHLEDDAIKNNSDILSPMSEGSMYENDHIFAIQERRADNIEEFKTTKFGFTAKTNYNSDRLVFFSVPYDKGWSASIDGKPLKIEVANIGFMAVRVPAGEQTVVFEYNIYGMNIGGVISIISLIGIVVGVWVTRKKFIIAPSETEYTRYSEI